jgi:hypothetical protein
MNNMFEYLSGGQCYTCGGKVRYALGGNAPLEEEQNPIADMSNQGQQIKQPTTLDANAKQLMKFLLEQLSKGTSERILKKTLVDSGVKSEQATQLLEVAKKEFTKITEQGDYVNEMARQRALQEEQAAALQNQMGMFNANDPMGMNPQAGEDPSLMAMQQGANQSQMGDQEMEAQGRYGGSMKRLRRYGAGGLGCPDGFNWDEMTAQCMPSSVTANTIAQGSGAMQFGAPQAQPNVKAGIDAANGIAIARAQATDARANATANFYGNRIANYDAKRADQKDQFNTAIGGLYSGIRADQSANPQNNIFQSWQNINNPPPVAPTPVVNTARDGGLTRFVGGGEPDGGCPEAHYWNGTTCVPVFGSGTPTKPASPDLAVGNNGVPVKGLDGSNSPIFGSDPNAIMGTDWSNNMQQTKMFETETPGYVRDNANNTVTQQNAYNTTGDRTAFDGRPVSNTATNPKAPVDPRLTNSPYIVQTDKNKIANIDSNWATRAMAVGNSFGDPRFAPIAGGFGPGLKFLMGAAAVAGGAGLGIAKGMAGNESRVYDDKGNVFFYNSKGDERRALNGKSTTERTVTGMSPEIGRGQYLQTKVDEETQTSKGINRKGQLVSYQTQENEPKSMTQQEYDDMKALSDDPTWEQRMQEDIQSGKVVIKREGGEWNPFVDNRRKLNISMPIYAPGGAVDTETAPYSQQEWANKTSRQFPLNRADWDAYNTYTANFNNPANATTPSTNGVPNTTDNTNNALSANPSATAVDTKEYVTQRGDPLGFQVASNTYQGFVGMNDAAAQRNEQKTVGIMKDQQRKAGNSMAMGPINTQGSYGTWNLNAGPGANQYVADLGHTQDWGTQLARFGGTKSYRRGGTYEVSPEDLKRIIEMGGEVEFLD